MTLTAYWIKVKEWWVPLSLREKQAVSIGGALLSVFILYQGLWAPMMNHLALLRHRIQTNQRLLVWMKATDQAMQKQVEQTKAPAQALSPVALLSVLQKQSHQLGWDENAVQFKQTGQEMIEMQFKKVPFDQVSRLLIGLVKQYPVTIVQLSATASDAAGVVDGSVVVGLMSR